MIICFDSEYLMSYFPQSEDEIKVLQNVIFPLLLSSTNNSEEGFIQ